MHVLTAAQSREADRIAIEERGIPSATLMENAARGLFEVLRRYRPNLANENVCVAAGKGNNGGDGRILAGLLEVAGTQVQVIDVGAGSSRPDAATVGGARTAPLPAADVIIDAIFGTGLDREVTGPAREKIEAINRSKKWVLAVDIPSGLSADTGRPLGAAVRANLTVTIGRPKLGLILPEAGEFVGQIEVVDIGIPDEIYKSLASETNWITEGDLRPFFQPRRPDSHKGSYGHLLLVGGSANKPGAILLAGRAALRTGAGLATVALPDKAFRKIPPRPPLKKGGRGDFLELMYEPLPSTGGGTFSRKGLAKIPKLVAGKDAIAAGPGIGVNPDTKAFVAGLIQKTKLPMVLDADGLNCIAPVSPSPNPLPGIGERARERGLVLTPHPGEMARLLKTTAAAVQKDRIGVARKFAKAHGVVVVLKGFRTVVATPEGEIFVNSTGNPGMAAAGMGDVLTGIIGTFLAQGMRPAEAAVAGVWLHGRAGDRVAARLGDRGLLAGDLIDEIPLVIKELVP